MPLRRDDSSSRLKPMKDQNEPIVLQTRLQRELHDRLLAASRSLGISMADACRLALNEWLNHGGRKP